MVAAAAQAQSQPADEASAPAQESQATELDRVTVTGIRAGIENAIETKKTSSSIVESISAEDIGKLPDLSIAESIARLPGLTAPRVPGPATTLNLRDLAQHSGPTPPNAPPPT